MIKRMKQIVRKSASDVWARLLTPQELEGAVGGCGENDGHGVGEPKPISTGGGHRTT